MSADYTPPPLFGKSSAGGGMNRSLRVWAWVTGAALIVFGLAALFFISGPLALACVVGGNVILLLADIHGAVQRWEQRNK